MQEIIKLGRVVGKPIEWIVLKKWEKEKKALVISKAALFTGFFDEESLPCWEKSDIRSYLNDQILTKCFSTEEQSRILPRRLPREKADLLESDAYDTYDRLFFLSIQEAERFFDDDDERKTFCLTKQDELPAVAWWLRSRIAGENTVAYVDRVGRINRIGHYADEENVGLRPAFYLDLDE